MRAPRPIKNRLSCKFLPHVAFEYTRISFFHNTYALRTTMIERNSFKRESLLLPLRKCYNLQFGDISPRCDVDSKKNKGLWRGSRVASSFEKFV